MKAYKKQLVLKLIKTERTHVDATGLVTMCNKSLGHVEVEAMS